MGIVPVCYIPPQTFTNNANSFDDLRRFHKIGRLTDCLTTERLQLMEQAFYSCQLDYQIFISLHFSDHLLTILQLGIQIDTRTQCGKKSTSSLYRSGLIVCLGLGLFCYRWLLMLLVHPDLGLPLSLVLHA